MEMVSQRERRMGYKILMVMEILIIMITKILIGMVTLMTMIQNCFEIMLGLEMEHGRYITSAARLVSSSRIKQYYGYA